MFIFCLPSPETLRKIDGFRTSKRSDLRISPAHRDGAGGLEFLGNSVEAFTPFIFGVMSFAAALVADFVVYEGDSPLQYQWHVIGLVGFLIILIAGPSLLFLRALYKAREEAIFRYGELPDSTR